MYGTDSRRAASDHINLVDRVLPDGSSWSPAATRTAPASPATAPAGCAAPTPPASPARAATAGRSTASPCRRSRGDGVMRARSSLALPWSRLVAALALSDRQSTATAAGAADRGRRQPRRSADAGAAAARPSAIDRQDRTSAAHRASRGARLRRAAAARRGCRSTRAGVRIDIAGLAADDEPHGARRSTRASARARTRATSTGGRLRRAGDTGDGLRPGVGAMSAPRARGHATPRSGLATLAGAALARASAPSVAARRRRRDAALEPTLGTVARAARRTTRWSRCGRSRSSRSAGPRCAARAARRRARRGAAARARPARRLRARPAPRAVALPPAPAAGVARARDPRRGLADARARRTPSAPSTTSSASSRVAVRRARGAGRRRGDRDLPGPVPDDLGCRSSHAGHDVAARAGSLGGDGAVLPVLRFEHGRPPVVLQPARGSPRLRAPVPHAGLGAAFSLAVSSTPATTTRRKAMPASNINRVVLTGQPDARPRAALARRAGTSVCSLRLACNTRRKNRRRRVGGQAQLLRRHRLGRAGRELRPLPRQGPPGRDRRPPRVARVGAGRHRQAPGRRDHRRRRPVPRRPQRRQPRAPARRPTTSEPAGVGATDAADDDIPF